MIRFFGMLKKNYKAQAFQALRSFLFSNFYNEELIRYYLKSRITYVIRFGGMLKKNYKAQAFQALRSFFIFPLI